MKGYQSWARRLELAEELVERSGLFAGLGHVKGNFTFGYRKRIQRDNGA